MISSRKIDYYVNDPYVTIIDIRLKEKYVYSRIKGAIHYEYNKLVDDINNIYKQYYDTDTNILNTEITNTYFNL